MAWLQENVVLVLSVLLGLSEVLALIPVVKANSIFQLVIGILHTLKDKLVAPKV